VFTLDVSLCHLKRLYVPS